MLMNDFTFLTLSYNQGEYIERHLNSIKQIISHYGRSLTINFILADDNSQDSTVLIAKNWLDKENIFANVTILEHTHNQGTVRNLIDGISHIQTRNFKLLAADDYYMDMDIFSLYKDIKEKIILTPLHLVGNVTTKLEKGYDEAYSLLKRNNSNQKMRKILARYGSIIPAPGVFFDGDFAKDKNFQSYLLQFNLLEDYPMWYYFINKFNCDVEVLPNPYINYNIGSGVSSSARHNKKIELNLEWEKIKRQFKIKLYILPKHINPYRYLYMVSRKFFYMIDKIKESIRIKCK